MRVSLARSFQNEQGQVVVSNSYTERLEEILTIARDFASSGIDSCLIYADEARRLSIAYRLPEYEAKALAITGNYYLQRHNYPYALNAFNNIPDLSINLEDSLIQATAYYGSAIALFKMGRYAGSLDNSQNALNKALNIKDTLLYIRSCILIAKIHEQTGNTDESLNYLNLALENSKLTGNNIEEAIALHLSGSINMSLLKSQDALGDYLSALKLLDNPNGEFYIPEVYISIGELYMDRGDYTRSIDYFRMAQIEFSRARFK